MSDVSDFVEQLDGDASEEHWLQDKSTCTSSHLLCMSDDVVSSDPTPEHVSSDCSDPLGKDSLNSLELTDTTTREYESSVSQLTKTMPYKIGELHVRSEQCILGDTPSSDKLSNDKRRELRRFASQPTLKLSSPASREIVFEVDEVGNVESNSSLLGSSIPALTEEQLAESMDELEYRPSWSEKTKFNVTRKLSNSLPLMPSSSSTVASPLRRQRSALSSHAPIQVLPPLKNSRPNSSRAMKSRAMTVQDAITLSNSVPLDHYRNEYTSHYVLPPIPTDDAKHRSYLLGNLSSNNALLGSTELNRYFPSKKINIFIVTWNMNGTAIKEPLDEILLPKDLAHMPDIYAIGVQELNTEREQWELKLQETLGPSHVLFYSELLGTLHLAIYLRRDFIWFCSVPESSTISTRIGSKFKTKGAVAIAFMFFGTSLLFITSHFTAHDGKIQERIADYLTISRKLNFPINIPLRMSLHRKDVTERFDNAFWFGDLNFRLDYERVALLSLIDYVNQQTDPNYSELLIEDQLKRNMDSGKVFKGFNEAPVNFLPTYKYDIGTQLFDTSSKLRTPSYTDRILYRSKQDNSITCNLYNSVQSVNVSDHRPVHGLFEVSVKPGRDNVPLAAGQFNRDIYIKAMKNRAHRMDAMFTHKTAACSSICLLM